MNIKIPKYAVWLLATLILGAGFLQNASGQAALRPGDVVQIRLGGVPGDETAAFSGQYPVDSRGALNLPYIGEIQASGRMAAEVQRSIESKLKVDGIYTNPTITVSSEGAPVFITVGGAVRGSGRIPYTPDMTLMTAISAAGGFNDFANERKVRLRRGGAETMFNAREIRKNPSQDPKLQPGDQLEVDESIF